MDGWDGVFCYLLCRFTVLPVYAHGARIHYCTVHICGDVLAAFVERARDSFLGAFFVVKLIEHYICTYGCHCRHWYSYE
jgi:hypothetical protein